MKLSLIALALLFSCLFASIAYAQTAEPTAQPTPGPVVNPPTPPANGQDLVNGVTALIATFAGLLGSGLTNLISQIPGLSGDDKTKLQSAVTEVLAVVVNVATGFAIAAIAQALDLIPDSGLQMLAIALATPLVAEGKYRLTKFSQPAK